MDEKFIMYLLSKIKCRSCGQQCEPDNIDVLGYQKDTWLFYTYCDSCKARSLVVVSTKEKGDENKEAGSVEGSIEEGNKENTVYEVASELTEEEMNKFDVPLSVEDVVDMHMFLKKFTGDFTALFAEK